MRFDVITLMPELVTQVGEFGVTARALKAGVVQLETWNPRDFTSDRHRNVDDRPYGGGPGMVMQAAPLSAAVQAARAADSRAACTLYLSPQGERLDQARLRTLSQCERLILVAGRYEGVDQRFVDAEVDQEISIGDYVLSGGELAAMVLIDGLTRLQPGALGDDESARQDSFSEALLEYPHYTRPEEIAGRRVPAVLLSGDHAAIRRWRRREALGRTWRRRPELLAAMDLNEDDQAQLDDYKREHAGDNGAHVAGENDE